MVSPDGSFAVTFPCKVSDIYVQRENNAPLMVCISHGVVFGAGRGGSKMVPGTTSFEGNFDTFLDTIRNTFGASSVKELVFSGHRAFQYFCRPGDQQACKLVIDLPPGQPLMLTGGDNPAAAATPEVWLQNVTRIAPFFSSLEILAK
ncbi:MAG: hypothetical protein M3N34_09310 [Pseudomonadota bacterium]|nr:hypothetical protein [Pseudomonadota bacterium]